VSNARLDEFANLPLQQRLGRIAELFAQNRAGDLDEAPPASPAQIRARRLERLREKPLAFLSRQANGLGFWLRPRRLPRLASAMKLLLREKLAGAAPSPEMERLPGGFCGRARSLAPEDLMDVYAQGLYPANFLSFSTLWSPAFRAILRPDDFASRSLAACGAGAFTISLDVDFDAVLAESARRDGAIWRNPALDLALGDLFDAGFAHSVEVRDSAGRLVAGLAGVACGGVFTVEALFADDEAALTQAIKTLTLHLQSWSFVLIDFKSPSALTHRLRCASLPAFRFRQIVAANLCGGKHGKWRLQANLHVDQPTPAPRASDAALRLLHRAQQAA
jgi:leucyl/phenylalanyl-tRNA--protein transferase